MKYKVTLAYNVEVEAVDKLDAEEKAEKALRSEMHRQSLREVMSVYHGDKLYIPENEYSIEKGYYDLEGLIGLLRKHKRKPKAIEFLADMLEP